MNVWPHLDTAGKRIGYARVSTREQHLRMQEDALEAVGCDQVFTDHGVSGAQASRPGLDEALAALTSGDVIIVYKLDRLGRSVLHLADLLTRFHDENIHFCSLSEGINTTTPGGKLVFHIFSAIAEFQRDLIRENTVNGLDAARRRGKRLGRPLSLTKDDAMQALIMITEQGITIGEAASRFGISHSTLSRAFKRNGIEL